MIKVEPRDNGVVCILLDRSVKRNAMTPRMLELLLETAEKHAGDRAIVLGGIGESFCAGFDLSLCREDDSALEAMLIGLSHAVRALRRAEAPVIVAAQNAAIAGGCALLGGGDIIITNDAAKLGYPVVRLGISPAVSAPTLRLLTGDGRCRERMLDPSLIDGREAVRIGLTHESLADPAHVLPRAIEVAQALAAKPRPGLAATKRWLNELDGSLNDSIFDRALGASLGLVGSEEQQERLEQLWTR